MSKPINNKEHNNAFIKFILFFLVTLAMAAGAIYYNFKIPNKELAILRVRSELLRNQQVSQEKYKRVLNDVIDMLEKTDSSSKLMMESELSVKIDALRNVSGIEDSSAAKKLHQSVLYLVNKYKESKFRLFDLKNFEDEIREKNNKIAKLKEDMEYYKEKLRDLNIER
jgi:hypothetical protein